MIKTAYEYTFKSLQKGLQSFVQERTSSVIREINR